RAPPRTTPPAPSPSPQAAPPPPTPRECRPPPPPPGRAPPPPRRPAPPPPPGVSPPPPGAGGTPPLRLEPVGPEHARDLWRLHQDEAMAAWHGGPWSMQGARPFASRLAGVWAADG